MGMLQPDVRGGVRPFLCQKVWGWVGEVLRHQSAFSLYTGLKPLGIIYEIFCASL